MFSFRYAPDFPGYLKMTIIMNYIQIDKLMRVEAQKTLPRMN